MKTSKHIEVELSKGMSHFQQEYLGRGPEAIRVYHLGELLVLTTTERNLVKAQADNTGRDLVKRVRTHLIETARPAMEALVEDITGVKMRSLHHDISTVTGEEIFVFALTSAPSICPTNPK
jgi:uncharacterized protein YbcI